MLYSQKACFTSFMFISEPPLHLLSVLSPSPFRALSQHNQQHPPNETTGPDRGKTLEQRVSEAWESLITPPQTRWTRAAVGVNSCVDVVVSGVALLEALGLGPGSSPDPVSGLDHEVLGSLEDLMDTFLFFMSRGAAAERFFSNSELFQTIAQTALQIPGAKLYVGGNAALIGQKLASSPDTEVLLSGPVGPKLHELLDEKIVVSPESLRETDEYHLILEYQTGEHWGPLVAPQANRFIFSHDEANSHMTLTEALVQSLDQFEPDLLVLSGLHMMEGLRPEARNHRLDQVVALLSELSVPVHLELASMTDLGFMQLILSFQVFPLVSSLGLNEQELLFLSRAVDGPHSDVSWSEVGVTSAAAVGVASDVLQWVLQHFGAVSSSSLLSRVHFHSLPFHVVAVVTGRWGNQAASSAAGARTASAQACGRAHVHAPEAQLKAPLEFNTNNTHMLRLDPDQPITVWHQHHVTFHLSPVLVCKQPIRTVGLGDAISANGLLFSEILPPK
uniref:Uncharacterized protein n=1 Tax=Periophthalmus magnuspinnatus TaxID=409849 RepID=A0A3B4B1F5_9GOBI